MNIAIVNMKWATTLAYSTLPTRKFVRLAGNKVTDTTGAEEWQGSDVLSHLQKFRDTQLVNVHTVLLQQGVPMTLSTPDPGNQDPAELWVIFDKIIPIVIDKYSHQMPKDLGEPLRRVLHARLSPNKVRFELKYEYAFDAIEGYDRWCVHFLWSYAPHNAPAGSCSLSEYLSGASATAGSEALDPSRFAASATMMTESGL